MAVKSLPKHKAQLIKHFGYPNHWDVLAIVTVASIIALFAWAGKQMAAPYHLGTILPIQLDFGYLPFYALRTILRMFIALALSLILTLALGAWAAKSTKAAKVLIPMIDILQSVPILGFLSITVVGFIKLFPDSLLGPECAAIFAILTSQLWNLILGFYQSVRSVPRELREVGRMFKLSSWQIFWRIEVSYALPTLLWNMMISMSSGWFFVVAAEAISVSKQTILLPGIGSYIATAIEQANVPAIAAAILTMFVVILSYDQLFFRPLLAWTEKFKPENNPSSTVPESWFLDVLTRTKLLRAIAVVIYHGLSLVINYRWPWYYPKVIAKLVATPGRQWQIAISSRYYQAALLIIAGAAAYFIWDMVKNTTLQQLELIVTLGLITAARVAILVVLCSLIWVPVGVYIGTRPNLAKISQPIAQFLAAFPANLFYPLAVIGVVKFNVAPEIGLPPLMILGAQWYILFNVIAGASLLPKELLDVANNFGLSRWLRWKRVIFPGILPHYLTGAITAAGGAWNASIVAEIVSWGNTTISIPGLGAYITTQTRLGNFTELALAISVMSILVVIINRLLWHPLYIMAFNRYTL